MSVQALNEVRNQVVRQATQRTPKINMDVEWFPCPHCGTEICAEMETAIFDHEEFLFFCSADCEAEYAKGRD